MNHPYNNNHSWEDIMRTMAEACCRYGRLPRPLVAGNRVKAADIELMTTGAVEYILRDLIPPFERATATRST